MRNLNCHDGKKAKKISAKKIAQSEIDELSIFFKALGDSTRSQILYLLTFGELCVHDISVLIDLSPSAASHQMRVLRNLRLVKKRKMGKFIYYSVCDEHISKLIEIGLEHIRE